MVVMIFRPSFLKFTLRPELEVQEAEHGPFSVPAGDEVFIPADDFCSDAFPPE
jgi:hypothetical protein